MSVSKGPMTYDQLMIPESTDWLTIYATEAMLTNAINTYKSILGEPEQMDEQSEDSDGEEES